MCRPQFKNLWFLWLRYTGCACFFIAITPHAIAIAIAANHGSESSATLFAFVIQPRSIRGSMTELFRNFTRHMP